jgi:tetratricopeptide (TPR) repeat protein
MPSSALPPSLASPDALSAYLVDEWAGPLGSAVEPDAYLIAIAGQEGAAQLRELLTAVLVARWSDDAWGHRASRGWRRLFRVISTAAGSLAPIGSILAARFGSAQSRLLPLARGPAADPWLEFLHACSVTQSDRALLSEWLSICDLPAGAGMRHGSAAVQAVVHMPDPPEGGGDAMPREDDAEALVRFLGALSDRIDSQAVRPAAASEYFALASRAVLRSSAPTIVASKVVSQEREFASVVWGWLKSAGIPVGPSARIAGPRRPDFASEANSLLDEAGHDGDDVFRDKVGLLLHRERKYAERSGDIRPISLSLTRFARFYETHRPTESVTLAREATEWAPFDSYCWTALIRAYRAAKEGAAGVDAGYRAIRRFPGSRGVWAETALVLRTLERVTELISLLQVAHDRFPSDERLCDHLAYSLRARSSYPEAEKYYRRALEISERRNQHSWDGLIVVLALQGRISEARETAKEASNEFTSNPLFRARLKQIDTNTLDEPSYADHSSEPIGLTVFAGLQRRRIMRLATLVSSDVESNSFDDTDDDLLVQARKDPAVRARVELESILEAIQDDQISDAEQRLRSALVTYPQEVTLLHAEAMLRRKKAIQGGAQFSNRLYESLVTPINQLEASNSTLGAFGDWNRLLALSITPDGDDWSLTRDEVLGRFSRRLLTSTTSPGGSDNAFVKLWGQRVQRDGRPVLVEGHQPLPSPDGMNGLEVLDQEYALLGSAI